MRVVVTILVPESWIHFGNWNGVPAKLISILPARDVVSPLHVPPCPIPDNAQCIVEIARGNAGITKWKLKTKWKRFEIRWICLDESLVLVLDKNNLNTCQSISYKTRAEMLTLKNAKLCKIGVESVEFM